MPQVYADVTRYRNGARDEQARAAHAADTTSWRRSLQEADFGPDDHAALFAALGDGLPLSEAAASVGQTTNAVYGRARWDVEFGEALEALLTQTCPGGDRCGRASGAKRGGHCARCRAAHHRPRGEQRHRAR